MDSKKKILMLAGKGMETNIVFNAVNSHFDIGLVIIEERETLKVFLKRRVKRLGLFTVLGQVLFKVFIVNRLNRRSAGRLKDIIESSNLDLSSVPAEKIASVNSVNAAGTIALIRQYAPDLIIVNGTRIISKKVLESTPAKFINTHTGITPAYRGVHGTYWALANNDIENSGVTVHYVDAGVDTGSIISQAKVVPAAADNFVTYPLLQLATGIQLLTKAVADFFNDAITLQESKGESHLYHHPTLWQYLFNRVTKKVK